MSIDRFVAEIDKIVDYYRMEYDLTYGELVGAIEILKAQLISEALENE